MRATLALNGLILETRFRFEGDSLPEGGIGKMYYFGNKMIESESKRKAESCIPW